MTTILAINGSYRENGTTDQIVNTMSDTLQDSGAKVEVIQLRDYPIEFCINCRECTQQTGEQPGTCVHHDAMQNLVDKIEDADGFIFASPTNFGSATAIFKRFMERLTVYAYWPWGAPGPQYRKAKLPQKKAVLVSSSAAPGLLGRLFFNTPKQLKYTAKVIGADSVGILFAGFASKQYHQEVSNRVQAKAKILAEKLLN